MCSALLHSLRMACHAISYCGWLRSSALMVAKSSSTKNDGWNSWNPVNSGMCRMFTSVIYQLVIRISPPSTYHLISVFVARGHWKRSSLQTEDCALPRDWAHTAHTTSILLEGGGNGGEAGWNQWEWDMFMKSTIIHIVCYHYVHHYCYQLAVIHYS